MKFDLDYVVAQNEYMRARAKKSGALHSSRGSIGVYYVTFDGVEIAVVAFNVEAGWVDVPQCDDAGEFIVDPVDTGMVAVDRLYGTVRP